MVSDFYNLDVITGTELITRMVLATTLAMLLGIERDTKNKPIDFRAFGLISLASCVLAIMSQELYEDFSSAEHVIKMDLGKIIAGVLTGIGFLGAGAIIKHKDGEVVGTATGATIWASGAIGLTVGFGFYGIAITMFVIMFIILLGGAWLARYLLNKGKDRERS